MIRPCHGLNETAKNLGKGWLVRLMYGIPHVVVHARIEEQPLVEFGLQESKQISLGKDVVKYGAKYGGREPRRLLHLS